MSREEDRLLDSAVEHVQSALKSLPKEDAWARRELWGALSDLMAARHVRLMRDVLAEQARPLRVVR
jgi:hypothetical protein